MAEALYRKYRPQVFEDVVGQEHIERTIRNAIEADKVSHAYLFTGPRGTGKTTTARLLAKALLCENGPTTQPDGTCEQCLEIAVGGHPDVYELDAASRTGVENVREEIIGRVSYAPTRGRYKVYIVDEVHMLSTAAFNALLKTLEEPPAHVVFILCTTDPHKVPETIQSRCQRFDFRRISNEEIVTRLGAICMEEGVDFEGDALELVASRAEGGMRNALTSLEQLITFGEGRVTLKDAERMLGALDSSDLAEIVRAIGARDVAACFRWTADYLDTGADLAQFTHDLAERVRTMYVLTLAGTGADVAAEVSEATRRELAEELPLFGADRLARMLGVLGDLTAELRGSTNPRLSFEIALTRMVRPDSDLTLEALAERIEALEQGYSARAAGSVGGVVASAAVAAPSAASQQAPAEVEAQPQASVLPADPAPAPQPQAQGASAQDPMPQAASGSAASSQTAQPATGEPEPAEAPSEAAPAADPATAVEPVRATPTTGSGVDLGNPASLQRLWQSVLAALKKKAAAHGVLFLGTKAVYDAAEGLLRVEFPAENEFAFTTASKPNVQEELGEAIAQAFGSAIPFVLAKGAADAQRGEGQAQAQTQPAAAGARTQPAASCQPQGAPADAAAAPEAQPASQPMASQPEAQPPAQQPAPQSQQTAEPPAAQAQAVPQAQPADDPDAVPLEAYGDIAPWEDAPAEAFPEGDAPVDASTGATFVADEALDGSPQAAPAGQPSPGTAATSDPAPAPADADDLNALLAFGFGEGASFTEVTE